MSSYKVSVVIPSYKRSDVVLTTKVVADPVLCVPNSQAKAYKKANPGVEIADHPDDILGLSLKRQWIYEQFGDVFMLDDDVPSVVTVHLCKNRKLDPLEFREIIEQTGDMCRQLGAFLFGFARAPKPTYYRAAQPFELTGFINGCAMGLLAGSKLKFPKDCTAVEDFYISALNAHYHRMAFIDSRYAVNQKNTFCGKGGQSLYRTMMETEKRDTEMLQRMFGDVIESKKSSATGMKTNGTRSSHPHERILRIPF